MELIIGFIVVLLFFLIPAYLKAHFEEKEKLERYKECIEYIIDYNKFLKGQLSRKQFRDKWDCKFNRFWDDVSQYSNACGDARTIRKNYPLLKEKIEKIDLSFGDCLFTKSVQQRIGINATVPLKLLEEEIDKF